MANGRFNTGGGKVIYKAGNNTQLEISGGVYSTGNTSPVIGCTFTAGSETRGVVRLKYEGRSDADGYAANFQVYKNGSPIGSLHTIIIHVTAVVVEDFSVQPGDVLTIRMYVGTSGHAAYLSDVEIRTEQPTIGTLA